MLNFIIRLDDATISEVHKRRAIKGQYHGK